MADSKKTYIELELGNLTSTSAKKLTANINSVMQRMHCIGLCLFLVGFLCGGSGLLFGESLSHRKSDTWPQWRGPKRNGTIDGPSWPSKLDSTRLKKMWHKEIGEGYPGPIVSADRVFTVETRDKKQEIVRAFDRVSGKQIWETAWDGSMKVAFFAARNGSWVRSTPAFDGECLYVAGMRDVLVCLHVKDGTVKWKVDFVKRFGTPLPSFGFVCSPLVIDGAVYVQAGASFVKLDKENGATIWRTLKDSGGMYGSAFSSPVLEAPCEIEQLLVQTRNVLAGIDLKNGKVLWQQPVKAFRGMNILTPIVVGNTLFTSSYGGASILHDLTKSNDGFTISEVWKDKKSQGYMSTPVVINGYIYFHRRDRRFCCLDPQAKKILWTSPKYGQYCSLIANGASILALDQKGELLLIDANPESFKLKDRRQIATQETWGHLAVAGDQVFVRELKALAVYLWREP
ncbi:MAG: PQQ-like beta-propeller repeat protein [Sedimentisphaerales bacterium]|nr:PQQ-like beta-propeller repeat protein [Sedimentisphaerales bacterium]